MVGEAWSVRQEGTSWRFQGEVGHVGSLGCAGRLCSVPATGQEESCAASVCLGCC